MCTEPESIKFYFSHAIWCYVPVVLAQNGNGFCILLTSANFVRDPLVILLEAKWGMNFMTGGGGERRPSPCLPQSFRNRQIFVDFNVSSENFRTFAVRKGKSFKIYRKIFRVGPAALQVPQTSENGGINWRM